MLQFCYIILTDELWCVIMILPVINNFLDVFGVLGGRISACLIMHILAGMRRDGGVR